MLDNLETVLDLNISEVIIGLVAILLVIKGIIELVGWLGTKAGIQFKWVEKRNADHKLLEEINSRLNQVETSRAADLDKSASQDDTLNKKIENLENKMEVMLESVTTMQSLISEIATKSSNNEKAIVEILYTMIDQKCEKYIDEYKGIPAADIKQFTTMFEVYTLNGGNHGLAAKVDFCLHRLPVLSNNELSKR